MITPSFSLTSTERVLPNLALDFTTASLDPRITFTRTTSASNPATYINSSGTITAATDNQPRFDYDPVTLLCKGLLIEESRTNSLLNTDLLSTQVVTVTAAVRTLSFYGTGSVTLSGAHTAVVSGTGAYPTRTTYSFTPTAGALTLAVTGAVHYAQLEAGAFATSYIPTTTTALTRNADVATMTGTNFSDWYNATEGTIVVNATKTISGNFPGYYVPISLDDGTTSNRIVCSSLAGSTAMYPVMRVSNVDQLDFVSGNFSSGSASMAVGYKQNNTQFAISGVSKTADTVCSIPTVNQLSIGSSANSGFWNGLIRTCSYYPQRLTSAELAAFTK